MAECTTNGVRHYDGWVGMPKKADGHIESCRFQDEFNREKCSRAGLAKQVCVKWNRAVRNG